MVKVTKWKIQLERHLIGLICDYFFYGDKTVGMTSVVRRNDLPKSDFRSANS